jgi:pyruvate-ferredoxin/flavodoxin oxidoreductase
MQSHFTSAADVWQRIPARDKNTIRDRNLHVYYIDMVQIARDVASEADLQMRMQGIVLLGAFLKLTPYAKTSNMTDEAVHAGVEKALRKYFGKRGEQVVEDNLNCVKRGFSELQEIPREIMHGGNGQA